MTITLDCCPRPDAESLRVLTHETHDMEAVHRCSTCGTYWFYTWSEYINWAGGDDDVVTYYATLTDDEAHHLLTTDDPPHADRAFLATRQAWCDDNSTVRRVEGIYGY